MGLSLSFSFFLPAWKIWLQIAEFTTNKIKKKKKK